MHSYLFHLASQEQTGRCNSLQFGNGGNRRNGIVSNRSKVSGLAADSEFAA